MQFPVGNFCKDLKKFLLVRTLIEGVDDEIHMMKVSNYRFECLHEVRGGGLLGSTMARGVKLQQYVWAHR